MALGAGNFHIKGVVMKGLLYSILTIILLIPIFTLSSTYSETLRGYGTDIGSNLRLKSGLYFLDSVNEDFDRAVEIVGRRCLTACINHVINEGEGIDSAEDSLMELFENKTLNGDPSDFVDYSIYEWLNKSDQVADTRGFVLEREIRDVDISMTDPWNVMFTLDLRMKLRDRENLFYYEKNISKDVPVSIRGLEDPLYVLNTGGKVTRKVERQKGQLTKLLLTGPGGNGWGSGTSIKTGNPLLVSDKDEKILVMDDADSSYSSFAGLVSRTNSTEIGTSYVFNDSWSSIGNNTKVVVEGSQGEIWSIENLYNMHEREFYVAGNGPSFLDRLEGNLENTRPGAGLESLVDKDAILEKTGSVKDRSNVDYIYFNATTLNIYKVKGMPETMSWEFKIDQEHLSAYGVDNTLSYA